MESSNISSLKMSVSTNINSPVSKDTESTEKTDSEQQESKYQGDVENGFLAQNLQESIGKIESLSQLKTKKFEFSVHEESKKSFVVVKDTETNEIIRQIPSQEVLELAEKIDRLQEEIFGSSLGLLFDQEI
ncbi:MULTISPECIES: flagellar protein FlaG [Pseudoalteromonas]|uniref:flagellar protein FlaG n=1 Tax=Pseudoalteromonas TaxID=53246 RepID=UPI0014867582|nr:MULTISPECIES: flagellar protein FlaG [Pseudoalteromonas]